MIREVVDTPRYRSQYKKFVRSHPFLKDRIRETLRKMREDVFAPELRTHRLSGKMYGLFACSCVYDCRIVFTFETVGDVETIILDSIGTHKQVY
jgi:mRNA-degrading endonuclease YafQ of YafQ-DinJ toxin-antitoxin module